MRKTAQIFTFSILKTFTRKTFITFAFTLFTQQMFAQVTDNFADGNFTSNPSWMGETARFIVASGRLQLQAPAEAGEAYLSTPSQVSEEATWEFYVGLGFNPSSANYTRVYLMASAADLSGSLDGYFVMVGNTADEISLYRQSGNTRTKIIDGTDARVNLSAPGMRIRVTRDAAGYWQLFSDVGNTGAYTLEGGAADGTHRTSGYFGVYCDYTATRSALFYFDDFRVSGRQSPPAAQPAFKDVILSEVFADPSPAVVLPDVEFVELYNRSTRTFNLSGWTLTDGASTATLPAVDLPGGGYVIIAPATSAGLFSSYGRVAGVSSFPSLNNTGDALVVKTAAGVVVDSIRYTDSWYRSAAKQQGGWSLEIIDPEDLCGEEENWMASEDVRGGTPGGQNSVFAQRADQTGPVLLSAVPSDATHLTLVFNERLEATVPGADNFSIAPSISVGTVSFQDRSLRRLQLVLGEPLADNIQYTLLAVGLRDCHGNILGEAGGRATFMLPGEPDIQDVVLNEVLFNPRPNSVDFVEIVNTSAGYFNLKGWLLGTIKGDTLSEAETISEEDLLLPPGGYLALTKNADELANQYPSAQHIHVMDMPSLNDDEGWVALADSAGRVLDHFHYRASYHSPFIQNDEGVSLERISWDISAAMPENWKSAGSAVGFATPGFRNSQAAPYALAEEAVVVVPEIFIPAGGQPDFAEIRYRFDQGGYMANVKIFDANGRVIKQVANNAVLATEGFLRWDGDRDDGSKARVGYYMVWVEVVDTHGNVRTIRKRVAIAARF